MTSPVCADASLIETLLIPERFSQAALELWREWMVDGWQVVEPMLLRYEVTSAIYRKGKTGLISVPDSREVLKRFLQLDIDFLDPLELPLRATELAEQFQRPNTYDAYYLALAETMNCPFWTGDERLMNAVGAGFDRLHWLGGIPAGK